MSCDLTFLNKSKRRNGEVSSREQGCFSLILHYTGSLVPEDGTAVFKIRFIALSLLLLL